MTADLKQPFSLRDLVTRIESITARGGWPALEATDSGTNVADLGPYVVDPLNIITMLLKGSFKKPSLVLFFSFACFQGHLSLVWVMS